MEKILAFFIPSFFIPSFSGGGGVTYKPTLIKEQAHVNAQNILMENGERLVQYDNLSVDQKAQIGERFPDYATPNKNHELVDYVKVDRNGNVISNTLTQSKFVGRNGAECFEKFSSKGYEKYFKNGMKMEIPKDFLEDFQKKLVLRSRV
nr:hypothetical protein [Helicobacter pylori]